MNIKSTKHNPLNLKWIKKLISYLPIDNLTLVFSLIVGILLGFIAMGFGSVGPIFIAFGVTFIIASFGAIDSGRSGFIYVIKLGLYSALVANLLVLYPSTKFDYSKRAVEVIFVDVVKKKGPKIEVSIYDKRTNDLIITNYYPQDTRDLVNKLYSNTKFIKYNIRYFPLIKYSRKLEYYDD